MRYVVPLVSVTVNDVPVALTVRNELVSSVAQRSGTRKNLQLAPVLSACPLKDWMPPLADVKSGVACLYSKVK